MELIFRWFFHPLYLPISIEKTSTFLKQLHTYTIQQGRKGVDCQEIAPPRLFIMIHNIIEHFNIFSFFMNGHIVLTSKSIAISPSILCFSALLVETPFQLLLPSSSNKPPSQHTAKSFWVLQSELNGYGFLPICNFHTYSSTP